MGKTIGSIFKFGSIAFLGIVTGGIGLGLAGGLTLGASFAGVAGALGVSTGALLGGIAVGVSSLSQVVSSRSAKPEATETAIKSPTPARVSGYGRSRLYGAYVLYTTAARTGTACEAYALHDGRIDGYERYYLGDKPVTTTTGIVPAQEDGMYGHSSVNIDSRLGLETETAYSQLIADLPGTWTAEHRGDGVATGMVQWYSVKTQDYVEVYPNGQPPLSVSARWQLVFDWRDGAQNVANPDTWGWSENPILHLAHYLLVRNSKDWATHFVPTLAYWTAAADDCDIQMALNGVQAVLTEPAEADGDHTLVLSTVNGLTPGMTVMISATGDTSLSETRIVQSVAGNIVTLTVEIANKHPAGSAVTWLSDGASPASEARYRGCVAHKHTDEHKGVIANLIGCFDGWMSPRADGALIVYSGRYYAPTVEIGPDQVIAYSLQDGLGEEDAVNQLAITYVSENHDFNTVDTDVWENAVDVAARGKVLAGSLQNQVPSASQARRLGKRFMAQANAPKRGQVSTNAGGRIAIGQRYVRLRLVDAGDEFLYAPVEITKLVRNLANGGVTFDWILADPNIDAWNASTEEGNPAPIGNPVEVEPLTAPIVSAAIFFGSDNSGTGTAGARIRITATGPDRADLTWFARWRVIGSASWNEQEYNDTDPGASVVLETGFVPVGAAVEVQVAYQVGDGRLSPYSDPPFTVPTGSITGDEDTITADATSITADRT